MASPFCAQLLLGIAPLGLSLCFPGALMYRALTLSGLLLCNNLFAAEHATIELFLSENQPGGWGAAVVIGEADGILYGEVLSKVILYSYQIGEAMDHTGLQYIAAFEVSSEEETLIAGPVTVGARLEQLFESVEIDDGVIRILGHKEPGGEDSQTPVKLEFRYVNYNLIPIAK